MKDQAVAVVNCTPMSVLLFILCRQWSKMYPYDIRDGSFCDSVLFAILYRVLVKQSVRCAEGHGEVFFFNPSKKCPIGICFQYALNVTKCVLFPYGEAPFYLPVLKKKKKSSSTKLI